jgi:hypothetical protein
MSDPGEIQQLASLFNVIRVDALYLENWIGAMTAGAYKFGYGLLRSADDEYDPFGVLAAMYCPDWEWDAAESAWAIDGNPLFLPDKRLIEALGLNPGLIGHPRIHQFVEAVTNISDGASSFDPVCHYLREGYALHRAETARMNRVRADQTDSYLLRAPYFGTNLSTLDPRRRR